MHLHYKTSIAGRGQKTSIKIDNILNTIYTNIVTTFDHYWKTLTAKKFFYYSKKFFSLHPTVYIGLVTPPPLVL